MPQPIGQHIVLRLASDRILLEHPDMRASAVRTVYKLGRGQALLAFSFVDTHAHLEVACPRAEAGELARRLEIALQRSLPLPAPFAPAFFEPIFQQRHLYHTFNYIYRQWQHHQVANDPFAEASGLPDLLGLRAVGGEYLADNLRRVLPRLQRDTLVGFFGLSSLEPVAYDPALDQSHLVAAGAAAVGLPDLRNAYRQEVVAARVALLQVAGSLLTTRFAAEQLDTSERAIRRLRQKAARPELVLAVRLQLSLRRQLAGG